MTLQNTGNTSVITDVYEQLVTVPVRLTSDTDTDSAEVDATKYDNVEFSVSVGVIADTATVAITLRESATAGGSYAAIASAAVAAAVNATNGSKTHKLPLNMRNPSRSKFLKCRVTTAGTTSSTPISVTVRMWNSTVNAVPYTQGDKISIVAIV